MCVCLWAPAYKWHRGGQRYWIPWKQNHTVSFKSLDVGAKDQTRVLWRSRKCS